LIDTLLRTEVEVEKKEKGYPLSLAQPMEQEQDQEWHTPLKKHLGITMTYLDNIFGSLFS